MLKWSLRQGLWDLIAWFKFTVNKPLNIREPPAKWARIEPKPMVEAIPEVPLRNVMVCPRASIPRDERSLVQTTFYRFQVWLYNALSPMQAGLPPIDADPQVALKRAFNGLRRTRFRAPELPAEYLGTPDLGSLAVRGPYACYTKRVDDATWEWDLLVLNNYEHHPGLMKIGSRVVFRLDPLRRALQADSIECALGTIKPTDPEWGRAGKIVLCAASTHLSLVRHFNWVHLAGGAQLAIATRNRLSASHPLCRLLWPYIYGTQQSNDMVTRGQMARGGDFETTFSFTFDGMCRLFDETYLAYPHLVNDPEADGDARKVRGAAFDTPTQTNLEALFDVIHRFVCNYLQIYCPRNAAIGASAVHDDTEIAGLARGAERPRSQWCGSNPQRCHLGQAGAAAGGPAVRGDGAARDPRQSLVGLPALDAPPAGTGVPGFPARAIGRLPAAGQCELQPERAPARTNGRFQSRRP